jgi:D-beta-D-heptose 7-phosphate kinase/D-beta-D-heptose 1-phosphate adenosyltransferase
MSEVQATIADERAEALSRRFNGKRIVVLGDLMLDEFIFGRVRRISPEAPVPVVEVERQTLTLGGAGNVAANLVALGAEPLPVGLVGDDADADRLRAALTEIEVSSSGLVTDRGRPTTLKTRIIAHNQQVVRADRESKRVAAETIETRLIEAFDNYLEKADAVVISDYNKGALTRRVLNETLALARQRGLTVCLDPKLKSFTDYQPVTIITPNHQEASEAAGLAIEDTASLREAGKRLLEIVDCRAVLITRGEEGMALFTDDGTMTTIATVAREVYDVTGAGDTVIATLTLALASGASFVEAAVLANHAASVVVGKLGTATVSRNELLATI